MGAPVVDLTKNRHRIAFQVSNELTAAFRRFHQPSALPMDFQVVVALLTKKKIDFVLMGTHGIAGWKRDTRSTQDIDVLVAKKHHAKAVQAVQEAYPTLVMKDTAVVTRFTDPAVGYVVIDLMKPSQTVFELILKNAMRVAKGEFKVPTLEMALVSKFAAMTSPRRDRSKKIIDFGDIVEIVEYRHGDIDMKKLCRLADKVYKGGSTEIVKLIDDIRENRPIQI